MTNIPSPRPVPELWTVNEVAIYLHVSKSWVYKNYRHHFTAYRTGQLLRFDPAEVKAVTHENGEQPA